MLERGHHPGRLQAPHVGAADRADQVGILADGLLDAPPAQIPDHVQDRRQALVHAEAVHGPADLRAHPLDEVRVEAGAPAQRRRVHRRLPGGQPGQALLVHHGRDPVPAGRHDLPLDGGHRAGAVRRADRGGAVRPGELPEPVADQRLPADLRRRRVVLVRRDGTAGRIDADPDAVQLRELLPDGHLGEQVAHPLGWAGVGIAPGVGGKAALNGHVGPSVRPGIQSARLR